MAMRAPKTSPTKRVSLLICRQMPARRPSWPRAQWRRGVGGAAATTCGSTTRGSTRVIACVCVATLERASARAGGQRGRRTADGEDAEEEGRKERHARAPRHEARLETLALGEGVHIAVHEHQRLRDADDKQRLAADERLRVAA